MREHRAGKRTLRVKAGPLSGSVPAVAGSRLPICDSHMLSFFDPDAVVVETLLFQTGCITITGMENLGGKTYYRLGYPNREVRRSLGRRLSRAGEVEPARPAGWRDGLTGAS